MSIEITYDHGVYEVTGDGAILGHALTYRAGYQIEAAYLEAKHSAMMGGDPLLIEAKRFAQAGPAQNNYGAAWRAVQAAVEQGDCPYGDDCPWCMRGIAADEHPDDTPLLSDCAAIIRRCLGQTTGAQSIVDELRRVEQRLTREGW